MTITLRKAQIRDLDGVLKVEEKSTPGLRYLGSVFDEFSSDDRGEFSVALLDGEIAGVGKFTILPDNSAWLEALRVPPEHQGRGVGKRFYERFFELAELKNIKVMRMYTNVGNATSKGLAERFGFTLAGTFRGMGIPVLGSPQETITGRFIPIHDATRGGLLLCGCREQCDNFVIMNRTFYEVSPALGAAWAGEGKMYEEPGSGSIVALGARFMPGQALHIAVMAGDLESCLSFTYSMAQKHGAPKLQYMIPARDKERGRFLTENGFVPDSYDCIVMERRL